MLLTIILTVYNKEQYLHRAFNSLLSQTDTEEDDYEVLVVNDGSTDRSGKIIGEYAHTNSKIRVLTQSNQGLSMARNNGVSNAKGEYVWFVDADDSIATDSVYSIIIATKSNPDIIPIYAETIGLSVVRNKIPTSVKTGRDILLCKGWNHCGPFFIYKKSFLEENNLHYLPGIYHEDSELTPRLLWYAKSVVVIPKVLYSVYRDPNSITQVPRKKRAYDYITVAESLFSFSRINISNEDSPLMHIYDTIISVILNNAFSIIVIHDKEDQKDFCNFLYEKRFLFKSLFCSSSLKYKIEYIMFFLFPRRYVTIYKILKCCRS